MVELDFRNCKTREDVEKVFDKKERDLEKSIRDLGKLRIIFFEEDKKEGVSKE